MPQRQPSPVVTLKTRDAQGEDSWIKVRRPDRLGTYRVEQQRLMDEKGITFDAQGRPQGGQFTAEEIGRMGLENLAEVLVEWNWVDGEGEPLPQPNPHDVNATIELLQAVLLDREIDYLGQLVADFLQNQAKTRPSGPGSRR